LLKRRLGLRFRFARGDRFAARFPAVVDPKPIGGVASHGLFESGIHILHDVRHTARPSVQVRWDGVANFDAPIAKAGTKTNGGMQREVVAKRKDSRRFGGAAFAAKKRQPHAMRARMLVRKQS